MNLEIRFVEAGDPLQLVQSLLGATLHQQPAWRLRNQPGHQFVLIILPFFSAQCLTHFHPARMGRIARAAVSERSLHEGMSMATQGRVRDARV